MKVKQRRTLTLATVKQSMAEYEKHQCEGQDDHPAPSEEAWLAAKFNLNERHAARYLAALQLPQVLQDAVESGALPLNLVEQVAHLNSATQAKIAEQVAAGEDVKVVAQQYLAPKSVNPRKAFALLIGTMRKCVPALRANLSKIVRIADAEDLETLDATASLLVELRQELSVTHAERQARQAKIAALLEQVGPKLDAYAQARDQGQSDGAAALAVSGADSCRNSSD